MRSPAVTFVAVVAYWLTLSLIKPTTGAVVVGNGNKDRNVVTNGRGYNVPQPNPPALYSAPMSHQEQAAQDLEVDVNSSTDRESTTTEIYFDPREEDTSDDYQFASTGTTPSPQNDYPNSGYTTINPTEPRQGYASYEQSSSSKNNVEQNTLRPLDQQQIENQHFPQREQISPRVNFQPEYGPPQVSFHGAQKQNPHYLPPLSSTTARGQNGRQPYNAPQNDIGLPDKALAQGSFRPTGGNGDSTPQPNRPPINDQQNINYSNGQTAPRENHYLPPVTEQLPRQQQSNVPLRQQGQPFQSPAEDQIRSPQQYYGPGRFQSQAYSQFQAYQPRQAPQQQQSQGGYLQQENRQQYKQQQYPQLQQEYRQPKQHIQQQQYQQPTEQQQYQQPTEQQQYQQPQEQQQYQQPQEQQQYQQPQEQQQYQQPQEQQQYQQPQEQQQYQQPQEQQYQNPRQQYNQSPPEQQYPEHQQPKEHQQYQQPQEQQYQQLQEQQYQQTQEQQYQNPRPQYNQSPSEQQYQDHQQPQQQLYQQPQLQKFQQRQFQEPGRQNYQLPQQYEPQSQLQYSQPQEKQQQSLNSEQEYVPYQPPGQFQQNSAPQGQQSGQPQPGEQRYQQPGQSHRFGRPQEQYSQPPPPPQDLALKNQPQQHALQIPVQHQQYEHPQPPSTEQQLPRKNELSTDVNHPALDSTTDRSHSFEFDHFHDNDNVVDAELLLRVQKIIADHERQQKELREKSRGENDYFQDNSLSDNQLSYGSNHPSNQRLYNKENSLLSSQPPAHQYGQSDSNKNNQGIESEHAGSTSPQLVQQQQSNYPLSSYAQPDQLNEINQRNNEGSGYGRSDAQVRGQVGLASNSQLPNGPITPSPQSNTVLEGTKGYPNEKSTAINSVPHIEYQKAILTEHFVETRPERPPQRSQYSPVQQPTTPRNFPFSPQTSQIGSFQTPSDATRPGNHAPNEIVQPENQQIQQQQRLIGYNQDRVENPHYSSHSNNAAQPPALIHGSPLNLQQPEEQQGNFDQLPHTPQSPAYPPSNFAQQFNPGTQSLIQYGNPNVEQRGFVQSPIPLQETQEQPEVERAVTNLLDYQRGNDQGQNQRTIIVHELPYRPVQGVTNRALISPNDFQSFTSQQRQQSVDGIRDSFSGHPNSNDVSTTSSAVVNGQNNFVQDAYQVHSPSTAQQGPNPVQFQQQSNGQEQGSSSYLPPTATPQIWQAVYSTESNAVNLPKPVYGVPLAPVVDPDSLSPSIEASFGQFQPTADNSNPSNQGQYPTETYNNNQVNSEPQPQPEEQGAYFQQQEYLPPSIANQQVVLVQNDNNNNFPFESQVGYFYPRRNRSVKRVRRIRRPTKQRDTKE